MIFVESVNTGSDAPIRPRNHLGRLASLFILPPHHRGKIVGGQTNSVAGVIRVISLCRLAATASAQCPDLGTPAATGLIYSDRLIVAAERNVLCEHARLILHSHLQAPEPEDHMHAKKNAARNRAA